MNAILVEICWNGNYKKGEFREMTEITAMQLHAVDGITVSGGTFHSYIRPVFQHWKKKKGIHSKYTDWWLAPTFPQVMDQFLEWLHQLEDQPWIVWDDNVFNIWKLNNERHQYSFPYPEQVVFLKKELKRRFLPMVTPSIFLQGRQGNDQNIIESKEKAKGMLQTICSHFTLNELTPVVFDVPTALGTEQKRLKQDSVIAKTKTLIENGDATLDDIAEWSEMSPKDLKKILFRNDFLPTPYQRKQLKQALIMWQTVKELRESWDL